MIILGVDPGINGALALLDTRSPGFSRLVAVWDMPTLQSGKTKKRSLDFHGLAAALSNQRIGHAFIEKTWNRPGEGHSGALVGCYMAVLATVTTLGIPWTAVAPQTWKKTLGVPAAKDGARARASQMMPHEADRWPLKSHDGRAEAALIAFYGMLSFSNIANEDAAQ